MHTKQGGQCRHRCIGQPAQKPQGIQLERIRRRKSLFRREIKCWRCTANETHILWKSDKMGIIYGPEAGQDSKKTASGQIAPVAPGLQSGNGSIIPRGLYRTDHRVRQHVTVTEGVLPFLQGHQDLCSGMSET